MQPVDWDEAGASHWKVVLRCPECGWSDTGTFSDEAVERFERELDRGTDALLSDQRKLQMEIMQDDIDWFVSALQAGHIIPEDF